MAGCAGYRSMRKGRLFFMFDCHIVCVDRNQENGGNIHPQHQIQTYFSQNHTEQEQQLLYRQLYIITIWLQSKYLMKQDNLQYSLGLTSLVLHPISGRILQLKLNGNLIISSEQPYNQISSGSYLMYPWVNRLEKPHPNFQSQFYDGNGLPLHGVQVNAQRIITTKEQSQDMFVIQLNSKSILHKLTQKYTLTRQKLTVSFSAEPITENQQIFCFGYHPFLQFNHKPIAQMQLKTNISENIKLADNLLPIFPFQLTQCQLSSDGKYDHLFRCQENPYLSLSYMEEQVQRTIRIESSDLKYWQIYTPPDGIRIAVEPMSFCGNLYAIAEKLGIDSLQNKGEFTISCQ